MFIREDTVFIPACFVSYNGDALDEKTPLHRAVQSMSTEGTRLLGLMGYKTDGLINNIGLEQELFFSPGTRFTEDLTCSSPAGRSWASPRREARKCPTTTWPLFHAPPPRSTA